MQVGNREEINLTRGRGECGGVRRGKSGPEETD